MTPQKLLIFTGFYEERNREEGARQGKWEKGKKATKVKTFSTENIFNEVSKTLSSEIKGRIFPSAEHQQTHLKSTGTKDAQHAEISDQCT